MDGAGELTPVIVSASRETDLPRFYCDWFIERLRQGWCEWKNSYNGKVYKVSFSKTRLIVFWSKDPSPMLASDGKREKSRLDVIRGLGFGNFYFQFTLNDYDKERFEPNVPIVVERVEIFKRLVDEVGFGKVIWRFDPLILTQSIDVEELLKRVERIGDALMGYTEKLVFSFVDIANYRKVSANLSRTTCREFSAAERLRFVQGLLKLNERWKYVLATCGEAENYPGIERNRCVDDVLMKRLFSSDYQLMAHLGGELQLDGSWHFSEVKKDKGQRKACGCIPSKDIGMYNTCPHLCRYCYANSTDSIVLANWGRHRQAPLSSMIIPNVGD